MTDQVTVEGGEVTMVRAGEQSPRRTADADLKSEQALGLFLQGKTYQQIADALGYADRSGAHRAVHSALEEHAKARGELAEHARPIVLARLEMLWATHFPKALDGEDRATELCLKMLDKFVKLHGLDAAVKIDATVTTRSELDAEIETLVARLSGAGPATESRP